MQVITSENFAEFVQNGSVPEFKVPEAAEPVVEQPRGEDGKFIKADEAIDNPAEKVEKVATDATSVDDDDKDLPERVRQKIGKKHRAMKEAEELAEREFDRRRAAVQRAEALERELEAERAKSRPAPAKVQTDEPKPEDFATVAEYTDALVDFKLNEREANAARQREEQQQAQRNDEFAKRMQAAQDKHPDFLEVVESIKGKDIDKVPQEVVEFMVESELGPDLFYHLAKNPETLDRLRKLSPRRFIAELGKLEVQIAAKPQAAAPVQPVVSRAPAPITPIEGGTTVVNKDPATMTFKEYREYERQQEQAKRRR